MCGIVGMVAKSKYGFYKKQFDAFFDLLRVDELRGEDSTGIIYVEREGDFGIMKEATQASMCLDRLKNHAFLKDAIKEGKALLGHNRKATVGKITDNTAHPFVVNDSFAMVHNGTLYGHKTMKDTEVDSEALAHHLEPVLSGEFDKEKFEEEVGKVNGAYAVGIYSQKNHKVFLMRNNQRPLAFVEVDDAFFWASEALMLLWILSRHGYDMTKYKIESVKEHELITIDLAETKVTREAFTPKKITPRTQATTGTGVVTVQPTTKIVHGSKAEEGSYVSKNEFKRLRRKWIGTRHSFFVDDYVETGFPRTVEQGEVEVNLLGDVDGSEFSGYNTSVVACVNLEEVLGKDFKLADITERVYHGIIEEMQLNRRTGDITLHIGKVKVFDKNLVKKITEGKWNATTPPTVQ